MAGDGVQVEERLSEAGEILQEEHPWGSPGPPKTERRRSTVLWDTEWTKSRRTPLHYMSKHDHIVTCFVLVKPVTC